MNPSRVQTASSPKTTALMLSLVPLPPYFTCFPWGNRITSSARDVGTACACVLLSLVNSYKAYDYNVSRSLVLSHALNNLVLYAVAQAKQRYAFSVALTSTKSRFASILEHGLGANMMTRLEEIS